jgi:hypothetical protein
MKSARLDALDREKRVLVARCADTRLQLARAAREVRGRRRSGPVRASSRSPRARPCS